VVRHCSFCLDHELRTKLLLAATGMTGRRGSKTARNNIHEQLAWDAKRAMAARGMGVGGMLESAGAGDGEQGQKP
jgi:hypothetical protein